MQIEKWDKIVEGIIVWARDNGVFPREYSLKRRVVKSFDEIKDSWTGVDEYLSVFNAEQVGKEVFDTIFFDIDRGYKEYLELVRLLGLMPSRLYYSGRGYHVYYDLVSSIEGKERYKAIVKEIVDKYRLENIVDRAVIGDVRRMARVPFSINSKTGRYMIMLRSDAVYSEDRIIRLATVGAFEIFDSGRKYSLSDFGISLGEVGRVERNSVSNMQNSGAVVLKSQEYPDCIKNAIALLQETGELDHVERLTLAMFMIRNGEANKLYELLKAYAKDFKEGYTRYQINYIRNRNLKIYKCSNIPDTICPYKNKKECPFYPSLNIVFESGGGKQ